MLVLSAIFSFDALLIVLLLMICSAAYVRGQYAPLVDRSKTGAAGIPFKLARVGERLSPYVAAACAALGVVQLLR